jgi:hypothetical protein
MAHLMVLLLSACAPDRAPDCIPDASHVVLTTTDFEVGAISALDVSGGCVGDGIASVGPDTLVRALGDRVVTAQRTGGDAVRVYAPGRYTLPEAEFVVENEGNVHDVARVGDELWLTLYDANRVAVTALDGAPRGSIPLAPYSDADGYAEPDLSVVLGDRLYVALQRLDRADGPSWGPGPGGLVLEIDPSSRTVLRSFDVGPNPRLYRHPDDDGALVVLTGVFFALDGALSVLRPDDDALEQILTEGEAGFDLDVLAGTVLLGTSTEEGGEARIECISLADGTLTSGARTDAWPISAVVAADGRVAVAVRTGWSGADTGAVWLVDPLDCAVTPIAEDFRLDPFDVAFVP